MASLREGLKLHGSCVVSLVGAGGKTSLMFRLAREIANAGETVLTTTTTKIFKPSPDQSPAVIISGSVSNILDQAPTLLKKHRHITAAAGKLPGVDKLFGFSAEFIDELWMAGLFRWIIVEADGAAGKPLKAPAAHEPVIPSCTKCLVGLVGLNSVGKALTDRLVFRHERFADLAGLAPGANISEDAIVDVLVHENGIFKGSSADVVRIAFFNQADVGQNLKSGRRIAGILSKRKSSGLNRVVIGQILSDPPVLEAHDLNNQGG